jgi:hypothetical protein
VVHLRIGFLGAPEDGARLIALLRAVAPVLVDLVGEKPFASIGEIHRDLVDLMGPGETELLRAQWADVTNGLEPWAADRGMANFLSPDEATDAEGVRNVYGPWRCARLAEGKRGYDPADFFRFNRKVKPARSRGRSP